MCGEGLAKKKKKILGGGVLDKMRCPVGEKNKICEEAPAKFSLPPPSGSQLKKSLWSFSCDDNIILLGLMAVSGVS